MRSSIRIPIMRSIGTQLTNLENKQKSYVLFDEINLHTHACVDRERCILIYIDTLVLTERDVY